MILNGFLAININLLATHYHGLLPVRHFLFHHNEYYNAG